MTMERGIITITENGTVTMPTVPVWMTQQEMSDAFNVFGCDIRRAVHAIYKNMELFESDTMRYIRQDNGISYDVYSLEMVITIAFRLRTKECMAFRRFVMGRLTMNNRQPVNIFFSLSPYNGLRVNN
ncbi:transporter [Bacteroides mediterraneensis]|nr:transporter [Bacteroides mediterraneensis]MBM6781658.1 transporter [Bacteroides mediterraneensis]